MNVPFKNTVLSWFFRKIVNFNKSKDGANRENNAEIFLQTQSFFLFVGTVRGNLIMLPVG